MRRRPVFKNVQTKQKIYFLGKKQDELVAILEAEEDFQDSSTLLEERMAQIGARVVTLTKFHPEFNPIECVYRFKNQTKIQGCGQVRQGPQCCWQFSRISTENS